MRVRRLTDEDWHVLREIRLRSLAEDHPVLASLEREQGFAESHWRMRVRGSAWFVAEQGGRPVGLASVMTEPGAPIDERHVLGLWVAPEARDAGVGEALLGAAAEEAWTQGAARVTCWRPTDDDVVEPLLRLAGFVPTGVRVPAPRDPSATEERWVCERDAEPGTAGPSAGGST